MAEKMSDSACGTVLAEGEEVVVGASSGRDCSWGRPLMEITGKLERTTVPYWLLNRIEPPIPCC